MATHKGFLAVAAPSRKGACPGACAPALAFALLPFSPITIFRAGDYAMNYFEYQSGRPCVFVVTSSFAICHVSVFTIIIIAPALLISQCCHCCSQCSFSTCVVVPPSGDTKRATDDASTATSKLRPNKPTLHKTTVPPHGGAKAAQQWRAGGCRQCPLCHERSQNETGKTPVNAWTSQKKKEAVDH